MKNFKLFILFGIIATTNLLSKNPNFKKHFPISFNESMKRIKNSNEKYIRTNKNWKKLVSLFDENIINNPKYSDNPRIPKIIHQIWLGGKGKLPEKYKHFQKSWLDLHPDWEYILWTEKEIDQFDLEKRKLYNETKNYGAKSDIARYEILYRIGGLYIDTDFECLKSFDILHHICDFYAGKAYGYSTEIYNGLIGAAPKHPILKYCIENLKPKKRKKESCMDIIKRTGPIYFGNCFATSIEKHSGPSVIFPVTYFYPWPNYCLKQNSEQIKKWINHESFAIHHWHISWSKK